MCVWFRCLSSVPINPYHFIIFYTCFPVFIRQLVSYVVLCWILFIVNWLATHNGDISLLRPSSLISHCYAVFPCFIIVSIWCRMKLNFTCDTPLLISSYLFSHLFFFLMSALASHYRINSSSFLFISKAIFLRNHIKSFWSNCSQSLSVTQVDSVFLLYFVCLVCLLMATKLQLLHQHSAPTLFFASCNFCPFWCFLCFLLCLYSLRMQIIVAIIISLSHFLALKESLLTAIAMDHGAALISNSATLSQTSAAAAEPWTRGRAVYLPAYAL